MHAGTLQCPACGAAASADAASCAYCKALLATVACPSCFGMIFAGTHFCPHCGAEGARASTGDGSEAPKRCPRCAVEMATVSVGTAPVAECGRCGGVWVDAATFDRIAGEREQQASVLTWLGGASTGPAAANAVDSVRYGPCPECGKLMNRVNFARCSGVVVDVCKGHGTWFDADELRRVVEFIRAGGMDRAREKERVMLEEERRRLQNAQAGSTGSASFAGLHVDPYSTSAPRGPEVSLEAIAVGLWTALRDSLRH